MSQAKPRADLPSDLTIAETGRYLNIGRSKIHELIRTGVLASYVLGPGRRAGRRIRRDSVERFRDGRAPLSAADAEALQVCERIHSGLQQIVDKFEAGAKG